MKRYGWRLKNSDKAKNYFILQINQNDLFSQKHKKFSRTLNYIEQLSILASAVTECV